ncbi:MAG: helix-turn-helix transcriptional regulator [Cyclobacteriaceae bacterium]|nr:MAG: helix-turn-helix transcriptional regulator [Cyclobacteriaceae bacterium]
MPLELGDIMKKLRESKGLNQTQLAEKTGFPLNTIHRYENDYKDRIPSDRLETIARALGETVDHFYQYKSNPTMLEEPATFYSKSKSAKVSVVVELDGSIETLNNLFTMLKKLNTAI